VNAVDTARSRRFDAELAEVLGDAPPAALAERIVAAIAAPPPARRSVPGLLVAAAVLFGTGVVTLVALSVASGREPDAAVGQDPKERAPIELRTVDVMEEGVIEPEVGDALDRIRSIARDTRTSVVMTEDLAVASEVEVEGLGPREAIERIAKEVGASVRDEQGVLVVGGVGKSLPRGDRITLKAGPCSVRDLVKQVHARTGVDIVVADDVEATVRCDVVDVPWYGFVQQLAIRAGGHVVGCGGSIAIRLPRPVRDPQLITYSVPPRQFFKALVTVSPIDTGGMKSRLEERTRVAYDAFRVDRRVMLVAISQAVGGEVLRDKRGKYWIDPAPARTTSVTLAAERMTAHELLAICAPELAIPAAADGLRSNASLFVRDADWVDVASAIAAAAGHDVVLRDDREGYEWR